MPQTDHILFNTSECVASTVSRPLNYLAQYLPVVATCATICHLTFPQYVLYVGKTCQKKVSNIQDTNNFRRDKKGKKDLNTLYIVLQICISMTFVLLALVLFCWRKLQETKVRPRI